MRLSVEGDIADTVSTDTAHIDFELQAAVQRQRDMLGLHITGQITGVDQLIIDIEVQRFVIRAAVILMSDIHGNAGAYNAIYQAAVSYTTEVDLRPYHLDWNTFYEVCNEAIDDVYEFDPDGPYRHFSFDTTRKTNNEVARLTIGYKYLNGADVNIKREQYKNLRSAIKIIVGETVTDDMSDYDKVKALHDYLVLNNEYDMRLYSGNMPHISYTAYGAILEHTSVCAGYAYAYEMLLQEAGVPVEYVRNSNHAWNIVQIDGEWYHVDTTWDDPTPDRKGCVRYDYFLRSDSFMARDYSKWTASHTCPSTKYDNTTVLNDEEKKQQEEQDQYNALVDEILAQMQQ